MSTENTEKPAENAEENAETTNGATEVKADPLAEALAKLQEQEKKYLYLYAEFENYRRRMEKERLDYIKFGHEGFLRDLLQVQDNFERAVEHAKTFPAEKGSPLAQIIQGIDMTRYQFSECLKAQGVTEVKSVGEKFSPQLHEAFGEEESSEKEPGVILKEHQRGYLLHGRLLRAARVVTAKKI